jgi:hypothetical protein
MTQFKAVDADMVTAVPTVVWQELVGRRVSALRCSVVIVPVRWLPVGV